MMKREKKALLAAIIFVVTLTISLGLVYWDYSLGRGRWEEIREIWLPEKYSLDNKVNGTYVNLPKPELRGSLKLYKVSLEEYKRVFNEGSVTITTNGTVYYLLEESSEMNKSTYKPSNLKTIYLASQELRSGDPELPERVEILSDNKLKCTYRESGFSIALGLIAAFGSFVGGYVVYKKIGDC